VLVPPNIMGEMENRNLPPTIPSPHTQPNGTLQGSNAEPRGYYHHPSSRLHWRAHNDATTTPILCSGLGHALTLQSSTCMLPFFLHRASLRSAKYPPLFSSELRPSLGPLMRCDTHLIAHRDHCPKGGASCSCRVEDRCRQVLAPYIKCVHAFLEDSRIHEVLQRSEASAFGNLHSDRW